MLASCDARNEPCGLPRGGLAFKRRLLREGPGGTSAAGGKLADFPDLGVLVGVPEVAEGHRFNSIAVLRAGRIEALCRKQHLPEYGVFDETRIFTPGNNTTVVTVEGVKVGLCICEDLWYPDVAQKAKAMGAEILVACNASPYEAGKARQRERTVVGHAAAAGLGLITLTARAGRTNSFLTVRVLFQTVKARSVCALRHLMKNSPFLRRLTGMNRLRLLKKLRNPSFIRRSPWP